MKFGITRGIVAPKPLIPFLNECAGESGAHLNSVYRGEGAAALLHSIGQHTQAEIYAMWLRHVPGIGPANPPGYSTHELRNDGVAYTQWARGARIPWWACGIDIDDAHVNAFISAAAKRGWVVRRTYPTSRAEYHHVNFRKPPLWKRLAARIASRKL